MPRSGGGKDFWFPFYFEAYRADKRLGLCSAEARGVWAEMFQLTETSDPKGYFLFGGAPIPEEDLPSLLRLPVDQIKRGMAELDRRGVFSRNDPSGDPEDGHSRDVPAGTPFCRGQVRRAALSSVRANAAKNRWEGHAKGDGKAPKTPKAPAKKTAAAKDWPGFDDWWAIYPRKVAKKPALKAFIAIRPDADMLARLMAAVVAQTAAWAAESPPRPADKIPHPASWLNGERWNDETATEPAAPPAPTQEEVDRYLPQNDQPKPKGSQ